MALYHGGFAFTGKAYPFEITEAEVPAQIVTAPGVYGMSVIMGQPSGRIISCVYLIWGQVSDAACAAAVDSIVRVSGQLTGTVTSDDLFGTYHNCVFLGLTPIDPRPRFSGGSAQGWFQYVRLNWIQTLI